MKSVILTEFPHPGPSLTFPPAGTANTELHVNPHLMVPLTSLCHILLLFWILREPLHWAKKKNPCMPYFLEMGFRHSSLKCISVLFLLYWRGIVDEYKWQASHRCNTTSLSRQHKGSWISPKLAHLLLTRLIKLYHKLPQYSFIL